MTGESTNLALSALEDALHAVGLTAHVAETADSAVDLVITEPRGRSFPTSVKHRSLLDLDSSKRLLASWRTGPEFVRVMIGDRITTDARDLLNRNGVGWFDRRGHLHLSAPGLFVDGILPASTRTRRKMGIATQVGREVATLLLLEPGRSTAVRRLAAEIGRAPSSVSEVLMVFRETGHIEGADVRDATTLFWALA